jgi:hypothetical protein
LQSLTLGAQPAFLSYGQERAVASSLEPFSPHFNLLESDSVHRQRYSIFSSVGSSPASLTPCHLSFT